MTELAIVIPVRADGSPETTLRSLARADYRDFDVIIVQDQWGNANAARNHGWTLVRSPFVLFCDDDIQWKPDGIGAMMRALREHPEAAYSYGAYRIGDRVQCNVEFDAARLRRQNFVSTMSVIRSTRFAGFDESLQRLQDWEMWLRMLTRGDTGVYCGQIVFETALRNGITHGGAVTYADAERIVKEKHGLLPAGAR